MVEEKVNFSNKYITQEQSSVLSIRNAASFEVVSNDTINEEDLLKVIAENAYKEELFAASLQMSIIGFGGRQYQNYKYRGEVKLLSDLFKKTGIRYNNSVQEKFDTDVLTPRRLLRLFRFQIKKYLQDNPGIVSYLFVKYNSSNASMRSICFPGGEHLTNTQEEADYIYEAYKKLDESLTSRNLQSGILERIKRVLLARGYNVV